MERSGAPGSLERPGVFRVGNPTPGRGSAGHVRDGHAALVGVGRDRRDAAGPGGWGDRGALVGADGGREGDARLVGQKDVDDPWSASTSTRAGDDVNTSWMLPWSASARRRPA